MQLLELSYYTAQLDQRSCSLNKQINVCYEIGRVFRVAAYGPNISGKLAKYPFDLRTDFSLAFSEASGGTRLAR